MNLPNIEYLKTKRNPTINSDTSLYEVPFYKDTEYFDNFDNFIAFIRACEKMIRTSILYSRYKNYLINDVGLSCCQVLSHITSEDATLEMHHGPILTLFDYCYIITDWLIINNKKVTTFKVADLVLKEHINNVIQVVMVTKTIHEQIHEKNIFINLKQAFGDLNAFINKYYDALSNEHVRKINTYIETSKVYDSFDKHVLDLNETIESWNRGKFEYAIK